ncbi:hypothetical protein [Mangrovimonas futianensis]|uniref:hypothetical protein n=1 Tax=Mangrovimonas futianensis TaxID=2895523 RepID=UPI0009E9B592|nr:hypothetical protein [Mangrovimonas futianensis]MCF1420133.1 hypothetical protein [Mangrovimonas futianensis]
MSEKKSILFISCDEAYHICDKSQYNDASLWEKLKLNLRLIWCKHTRGYISKNKKLTHSLKQSKVQCMKHSEKQSLKDHFSKELQKQNQSQP